MEALANGASVIEQVVIPCQKKNPVRTLAQFCPSHGRCSATWTMLALSVQSQRGTGGRGINGIVFGHVFRKSVSYST